ISERTRYVEYSFFRGGESCHHNFGGTETRLPCIIMSTLFESGAVMNFSPRVRSILPPRTLFLGNVDVTSSKTHAAGWIGASLNLAILPAQGEPGQDCLGPWLPDRGSCRPAGR